MSNLIKGYSRGFAKRSLYRRDLRSSNLVSDIVHHIIITLILKAGFTRFLLERHPPSKIRHFLKREEWRCKGKPRGRRETKWNTDLARSVGTPPWWVSRTVRVYFPHWLKCKQASTCVHSHGNRRRGKRSKSPFRFYHHRRSHTIPRNEHPRSLARSLSCLRRPTSRPPRSPSSSCSRSRR